MAETAKPSNAAKAAAAEPQGHNSNGGAPLEALWARLEGVSQRLWNENSPSAAAFQALVEEFRGEVHRESRLVALANERIAVLQAANTDREAKMMELLNELSVKEAQNLEFHDKFLLAASKSDEMQAKKMDVFYQDMQKRQAELESGWEVKYKDLENEHLQRTQKLKKDQEAMAAEIKQRATALETEHVKRESRLDEAREKFMTGFSAWEAKKAEDVEALNKRERELAARTQELALEYKEKQAEFQKLKEALQREVAEIVRQYQARLRGEAPR